MFTLFKLGVLIRSEWIPCATQMSGTTRRYREKGDYGEEDARGMEHLLEKSPPKDAPEWTIDAGIVILLSQQAWNNY